MRAIIADDHPLYREAVRLRLERLYSGTEVAEAATIADLLRLAGDGPAGVDLILVDLHMPGMAGARAIAEVVSAFPGVPVVMMSGLAAPADVTEAVRAGARGFLPKTMEPELFAQALSLIIAGGSYLPTDVLSPPPTEAPTTPLRSDLFSALTPREQEVLVRLAVGASNKEIGRDLGLAEVTVKLHVRQILKKIGARNRSEAASLAAKAGLI